MKPSAAGRLAVEAAVTAGRTVLRRAESPTTQRQTLTFSRPVETVLRACRDPEVLSTLLGPAGQITVDGTGTRVTWTVADTSTTTDLILAPNRVAFRTTGAEPVEVLVVEAWPEPRWGGSEVVLRLHLPADTDLPGTGDLAGGALAFTALYRLRALLQTGEVPTLGKVPSGRSHHTDDGEVLR